MAIELPKIIDSINILESTFLAMNNAISKIHSIIDYTIIDGNKFKTEKKIKYKCIVEGDNIYQSNRERNWFEVNWLLYNFQLSYNFSEKTSGFITAYSLDAHRFSSEIHCVSLIFLRNMSILLVFLKK